MDEQELQEAFQEYQVIQQQMEALEEFTEDVQEDIQELTATQDAVKTLQDAEEGDEVFFPVGPGAFAIGELTDTDRVLVDIGAETFSKKSVEDADAFLDGKKEELREQQDEIQEQMQELQDRLQELAPKLQELQQAMAGQGL